MKNIDKHIDSKILIILTTNLMTFPQLIANISLGNNHNLTFFSIQADKKDSHLEC
jgi:hypothetical protein